jgi:hypothetical protein
VKDSKPIGFGWGNQFKFGYAEFKYTTTIDEISNEEEIVFKNLKQEDLRVISYVKNDRDKVIFDPNLRPLQSIITQFHIIFIYETNITVLSSITQEIIFSRGFETFSLKTAIYDILQGSLIVAGVKD